MLKVGAIDSARNPPRLSIIIFDREKVMALITDKKSFMLNCGIELSFSVFDDKLLFAHSRFMSGQYIMKKTDIQITKQSDNVKVGFTCAVYGLSEDYQSYYFKLNEYEELKGYFKELGYPVP